MLGVIFFTLISTLDSPLTFKEKIEARAGSEIITTTDLEQMVETMKIENPQASEKDLRQRALQTLIDQALISQFLDKMGITVTDREIDQRINSIRTANGIQSQEQFRALLEKQGLSFDKFKTQLKRQMESGQFYGFIRRQATHTIEEKDLRAYYQNNMDRYKSNLEIEIEECIVPSTQDDKAAESEAIEFSKATKGFSKCAAKHSSTVLGKFQRGMLRDDIESKVFSLKPSEVAMFKTRGGYQLLRVTKIKNLGAQSFESVKESIRESLETEIVQKEYQRMMSELKASTFIKI